MRPITYVCLAIALAIPSVVHAGQVYGTIVMDGKGVGGANVEITCGSAAAVTGDDRRRRRVPDQRGAAGPVHARASRTMPASRR